MERETGVEPATSSLGSWHSTTELLPHSFVSCYLTETKGRRPESPQSILSTASTQIYLVGSQNGQHNGQHDSLGSCSTESRSCRSGFHDFNIANGLGRRTVAASSVPATSQVRSPGSASPDDLAGRRKRSMALLA